MKKQQTIVDELKKNLEHADAEKLEFLQQSVNPVYWFLLLAEHPEFTPNHDWWFNLQNRCDLPWSKLLAKQPQLEKYCHWESVSRLELMLLADRAPEIFNRKFPFGNMQDLYAFLTPLEKSFLLAQLPEYANLIEMEDLNDEFGIGEWFNLLSEQPQFEKYFDWSKIEKLPCPYWDMLLQKQPQFAIHCDLEQLQPNQRKRLLIHQAKIFENENQSFTKDIF